MKKFFLILSLFISVNLMAQQYNTALILIDIQNFYYPGGDAELHNPKEAGLKAKKVLEHFRKTGQLVIHIRHDYEPGGEIHEDVKPIKGEKVITKKQVNAFKDTDLLDYLKKHNITNLVLAGMQTHMCLEAATRAAHDYNFKCIVISDACTTRDLTYKDKVIRAEQVHYSTLATLKSYATIMTVKEYLNP